MNLYNHLKRKIEEKQNNLYFNCHKIKIEIMEAFNKNLINGSQADNLFNML